ncbi:MAG: beta-lactamase domain protein [Ignavibacteria bacterium]|nr:beta-lactamase domain protein [Ignavibacteria bacterium]
MKKKSFLLLLAGFFLLFIIILIIFLYPAYKNFFNKEIVNIDNGLTLVIGGGGNSGIVVGEKTAVVIDTKLSSNADDLFKLAKSKAGNKPIIVINTHYHTDHTKGNKLYKGSPIYIGNYDLSFLKSELKDENMPTNFVKDSLTIDIGGEKVKMFNLGRAHTFSDLVVLLENRKYLFSGDLIFQRVNPVLKRESGADVGLWLKSLEHIIGMEIVKIIPGHGKPGGKEIVKELIRYFEDMKVAASDKSKEDFQKHKYAGWMKIPGMASPEKTIEYIRNGK